MRPHPPVLPVSLQIIYSNPGKEMLHMISCTSLDLFRFVETLTFL